MIRLLQRISLPFLCGLALILIPLSTWAQSAASPQDRTDQTDVNQANQNVDHTQDQNQNQSGQSNGHNDMNRQKPSGSSGSNAVQNQQNPSTQTDAPQGANQQRGDRSATQSGGDVNQGNQADNANRGLPATAEELPLLALIGCLSLIGAFATRAFAKSNR